jgi:acetoin utilization protein AcuB
MTTNPITVSPETSVAEASDVMREHDIRHLPVVKDGALVGMLSDRDLGYVDFARLLTAESTDAFKRQLTTPIIKVMNSDVISVEPDTDLGEVVGLMVENKVGAIPVVGAGGRRVVGIVSYVDVLRAVQDLLEEA